MSINSTQSHPDGLRLSFCNDQQETSNSAKQRVTWSEDHLQVIAKLRDLYNISGKGKPNVSWSKIADRFYEETGCRRSITSIQHKIAILLNKEKSGRPLRERPNLDWSSEEVDVLKQIMEANKDEQGRIGWPLVAQLFNEQTGGNRGLDSIRHKGKKLLEKKHMDAKDSTIPRVNNHTDGVQKKRKPESLNPDTLRLALSNESSQSPSRSNSPITLSYDENSTEDFSKLSSEELIERMFDRLSELPDTLDLEPNEALIDQTLDEPPSPLSGALFNKTLNPDACENIESLKELSLEKIHFAKANGSLTDLGKALSESANLVNTFHLENDLSYIKQLMDESNYYFSVAERVLF